MKYKAVCVWKGVESYTKCLLSFLLVVVRIYFSAKTRRIIGYIRNQPFKRNVCHIARELCDRIIGHFVNQSQIR